MKSKNRLLNDRMDTWDDDWLCRWMDSRKAYRKARWLKLLNRMINRKEDGL